MDVLDKLFGGAAKVKIIKLFLFNPSSSFDIDDIADRSKVSKESARRECASLQKIKLIRPKSYTKSVKRKIRGKRVSIKKKTNGWILNSDFRYVEPLETFLGAINPFKNNSIINKISRTGRIQLLLLSGIFIKSNDSRVDILVVGDGIKKNNLDSIIKTIESEMGREIRYAVFDTKTFQYRYYMFDKLIRDIFDYPHQNIINKLNLR
jgi:hypothetical protein